MVGDCVVLVLIVNQFPHLNAAEVSNFPVEVCAGPERIEELEIACIKDALQKTNGNKLQASKLLGITRQGLDKKLRRYKTGKASKSST